MLGPSHLRATASRVPRMMATGIFFATSSTTLAHILDHAVIVPDEDATIFQVSKRVLSVLLDVVVMVTAVDEDEVELPAKISPVKFRGVGQHLRDSLLLWRSPVLHANPCGVRDVYVVLGHIVLQFSVPVIGQVNGRDCARSICRQVKCRVAIEGADLEDSCFFDDALDRADIKNLLCINGCADRAVVDVPHTYINFLDRREDFGNGNAWEAAVSPRAQSISLHVFEWHSERDCSAQDEHCG